MSMPRSFLLALCGVGLAGCIDNVSVQNRYNQERDECRGQAEERFSEVLGARTEALDDRSRNTELATLFSQCMGSRGWTVATPSKPRPTDQVAENRPFPGQTMPPPAQTSRVPAPAVFAPYPAYPPYSAPPPGYVLPPGAVMMPPPQPPVMMAPPSTPVPVQAARPVPQPAPQPLPAQQAQPATSPRSSRNATTSKAAIESPASTPQDVLDRQLSSPTSQP